jgi:hypothetical protein
MNEECAAVCLCRPTLALPGDYPRESPPWWTWVHQEASCTLQVTAAGEAGATHSRRAKPNIEGQNSGRRRGNRRLRACQSGLLMGLAGRSLIALCLLQLAAEVRRRTFSPHARLHLLRLQRQHASGQLAWRFRCQPSHSSAYRAVSWWQRRPGHGPAMMVPAPRRLSHVSPIGACMLLTRESVRHANPPRDRG